MNKIVCDVCGTSYPDNANQCPICGYVKPSKAKSVPRDEAYVYVKGGRFSAANVQKRNLEKGITPSEKPADDKKEEKRGSNLVLGIIAIILLLIMIAVTLFFIVRIVDRFQKDDQQTVPTDPIVTTTQTVPTTKDPDVQVPCKSVTADVTSVSFAEIGESKKLSVKLSPENTTDSISFQSADETVATVSGDGAIVAVAAGETKITVICGKAKLEIAVVCSIEDESTQPTETTAEEDEKEEENTIINREDITFSKKDETWDLYNNSTIIPKNKITWTSDDETVATIEDGVITAVGKGKTTVYAEYENDKFSCTVRCNLPEEEELPSVDTSTLKISSKDVTLKVSGQAHEKTFNLFLQDAAGNKAKVTWTASKDGYVTIEGNKITAVKAIKQLIISTTYEGETYECVVRIN